MGFWDLKGTYILKMKELAIKLFKVYINLNIMILVNSLLVNKEGTSWIYYCNVFQIENNTVEDISEKFDGQENFEYDKETYCLKISHWSWTAYNRIKAFLNDNPDFVKEYGIGDINNIVDVSLDGYKRFI